MAKYLKLSFVHSFLAAVYIVAVAQFMAHAEIWFGKEDNAVTPVVVLLLFTLSVLVVGGLVIGKPIFLYIDGKKKDAVWMLIDSGLWLFLFFIIALVVLYIVK